MKNQTACLVSLIFAAVLLLGTGCAPQQPKEITLIFKMPTLATASITNPDIKEAYDIFKEAAADFSSQYKAAQVSINLVKFDLADETAYITDCFDSPDAPDLLYEDFFNMSTYIYTGPVIPLDSIISAEWRADVDSSYWQMSQVQGKTYMLPYLARQNVMGYHRSMLRNAGLGRYVNDSEDIGTWSLSDWNTILGTLAAKLPENCYGEAMYAQNEQSDTHIMTMLRSHGSGFFSEDGHFNLNTAEGIAALSWIKSNADKGCYPPHSEQLAARDCGKLFWNNQLAVKMINGPGKDSDDKDIGLVNFPSLSGRGYATAFVTGFELFDNGDPAKIKAAEDFLKFFYSTQKYLDYSAGNMPVSRSVTERYKDRIFRLGAFQKNQPQVVDFMHNNPNWRGVRAVFYRHIQDLLIGTASPAEVAAALDHDCNAAIDKGRAASRLHE